MMTYEIKKDVADCTFWRTARKQHGCNGGHDGDKRTICHSPIKKGERYVEFCGEFSPFTSGNRYHWYCALQQGLLEKL